MRLLRPGLLAALALFAAGCAPSFTVDHEAGGAVRLRCRVPLAECLSNADWVCGHRRYVVLRAVDDHDRPSGGVNEGVRTSEALLRCGPPSWPPGFEPMSMAPQVCLPADASAAPASRAPAAAPPQPPPAPACVRGSTQHCVGPAGCSGGQACLADGSGWSPCDCGGDAGRP
jgi:hypothetical protein